MVITLDQYAKMNKSQQTKLEKEEIQQLLDTQLALTNNDPQEIRNVITNSINQAIDKKFEQITRDVNTETQRLLDENILIRKVITEQQKTIERLHSDKTRNNVFMTGIPTTLFTDTGTLGSTMDISAHVIKYVSLDISQDDYKIVKSFEPKEGQDRHSAKLVFTCDEVGNRVLSNSRKLKELDEDDVLRKVFIKRETSPLTRKENDRLYKKLQKLKEEIPNDRYKYKLEKGKLKCDNAVLDEFNITKSLFL